MSIKNLQEFEQEVEQQEDEEIETVQQSDLKELYENQEQFMQQINQLNEQGIVKIKVQKYQEALKLLQQSEQMLEYATSCGKQIDKNLIIVILYNQACCYQCQWVLDKCSKYLSGVIYNMDDNIQDEDQNENMPINEQESNATQVKKKSFLARSLLQQTAILSQLGKHTQALQTARNAAQNMRDVFVLGSEFCKDWFQKNESLDQGNVNNQCLNNKIKKQNNKFQMKDEVEFSRLVINSGKDILIDMLNYQDLDNMPNDEQLILREAKKQLYFWKNNPLNNEKHIRKQLKLNNKEDDYRSILGVQNVEEWIQSFNVSYIMHMTPQIYSEFRQQGEMLYEISKRLLFEKIIQLSISYFTIATELRFIELEKAKQKGIKDIITEEFKLSELYHLKAIEIACKHISCSSQYINHLITTYHKHYNSNLDIIQEESITSVVSEQNYKEQKLQQLKQIQIQTKRENQIMIKNVTEYKLNDSSPTGRLVNSFKGQQSLKVNSNIGDNLKTQVNLLDQIIRNKRKQQIPSDFSPKQRFQFLNSSTNTSCDRVNDKMLKLQDGLAIQLQPYKSTKTAYNQLLKQTNLPYQQNNHILLKSFLLESSRVERQKFIHNHSLKRLGKSPNKSPDKSHFQYKPKTQILQNKTQQPIYKLEIEPQFPIVQETFQQSLFRKSYYNQKRK